MAAHASPISATPGDTTMEPKSSFHKGASKRASPRPTSAGGTAAGTRWPGTGPLARAFVEGRLRFHRRIPWGGADGAGVRRHPGIRGRGIADVDLVAHAGGGRSAQDVNA